MARLDPAPRKAVDSHLYLVGRESAAKGSVVVHRNGFDIRDYEWTTGVD